MNKRISGRNAGNLLENRSGATTVEFAFVIGILIVLSMGIVDFTLLASDCARAAEATRRGARIAAIEPPVGNLDKLATTTVTCTSTSGTTTCDTAAVVNATTFTDVVAQMQAIYPAIKPQNVEITYSATGIGLGDAGGYKPYVQVEIKDLKRSFYALQTLTGVAPSITMPSFATTMIGNPYIPTGA